MKNHKTTTAAFIAAFISLAFLFAAVPLADTASADPVDVTELDFFVPMTKIIIADDLPTSQEGAVGISEGKVYQWIDASIWLRPTITVDDPANQFVVDFLTEWYRFYVDDPHWGTQIRVDFQDQTYIYFAASGSPLKWMISSHIMYNYSAFDVADPVEPPLGVTTLSSIPIGSTYDIEIISWESLEFGDSGWVFIADLPSSGGAGTTTNNIPWEYILAALVVGIIVGVVARSYGDD